MDCIKSTTALVPLYSPVREVQTDLVRVACDGAAAELIDRLAPALRAWDRQYHRLTHDPAVLADVLLLADCLPDSAGPRRRRIHCAALALIGTRADVLRFVLRELADECRGRRYGRTASMERPSVTVSRARRKAVAQ